MFHSVSASEAVKVIKSNDRVYIHTAAAAPQELIDAMTARADSPCWQQLKFQLNSIPYRSSTCNE